jgi:uncharacterized membrane protein
MSTIQESIEVTVPVDIAYNQWTQFEEFPRFMEGVKSVQQYEDTRLRWLVEVGGREKEWLAAITQQEPDRLIAWEATDGTQNSGEVTFEPMGPGRTRVNVNMGFEPDGVVESLGAAAGVASRRVKHDLERFRDLVESGESSTDGWRGEVESGEVQDGSVTGRHILADPSQEAGGMHARGI